MLNDPHNEPLILLDVRGLLIRRYSVADTSDGVQGKDGKVYAAWYRGVLDFLTKDIAPLLEVVPPRRIICCWDGGNNHRLSLYPDYKKARRVRDSRQDSVQKEQFKELYKYTKKLTAYLGVKHVMVPGQEADDLIALFCRQMSERHLVVQTVDADLLQLAGDCLNVQVDLQGAQETSGPYSNNPESIYFKSTGYKGTPLDMIRLRKSLVGDSSDSYAGVSGVGEKAWAALVDAYGYDGMAQMEECVKTRDFSMMDAALTATEDKTLARILSRKDEWMRSYALASLNPDTCYQMWGGKVVLPEWYVRLPLKDEFSGHLSNLGADDLLPQFERFLASETLLDAGLHLKLRSLQDEIITSPLVAYDFESEDTLKHEPFKEAAKGRPGGYVDVLSQLPTGISFCIGDNLQSVYYVPLGHKDTYNLSMEWGRFVVECCSANPVSVVQNANFELSLSRTTMDLLPTAPLDTAITASYVNENNLSGLKFQSLDTYRYHQTSYQEVTQGRDMSQLTGAEVLSYGCDDSLVSAHLLDLHRLIMQLEGSWDFYLANEVAPAADDVDSFVSGTRIDFDYLEELQRIDLAMKHEKIDEVRSALELHCMRKPEAEQTAHATTLLQEQWAVTSLKLAGKSDPQREAARNKLWAECWQAAVYRPYTEEKQQIEFAPTPKQLTAVANLLGVEGDVESNTGTYLSVWLSAHEETLKKTDLGLEFFQTIGPAVSSFTPKKKRHGDVYEAFKVACLAVLSDKGGASGKLITSGNELNFDSPKQMTHLLYGMLGLPVRRRSKVNKDTFRDKNDLKGAPATGNKAIASALVFDELNGTWKGETLLAYKTITACLQNEKLYYKPYPLWQHPRDSMLHPQFKNCGTVTRRPTGTAPNDLQVSKKEGAKIRKAYLPWKDEHCWVCHDFAGQELRLTASESKDPAMLDAYLGKNKKDIHSLTASGIAQYILPEYKGRVIPYEEFIAGLHSKELSTDFGKVRGDYAKQTNFLILYGGGGRTLAENLLIPIELADNIIAGAFRLYARLQPWQREVAEFGRTHGYVQTAHGNRKHLTEDILSSDSWLRARAERQAINQTIQGEAADILKIVRQEMTHRKMYERYNLKSVKPIYDEVAASCPIAAAPEYSEEMAEIMAITPPGHAVPMEAEVSIGLKNWGDTQEPGGTDAMTVQAFIDEYADRKET